MPTGNKVGLRSHHAEAAALSLQFFHPGAADPLGQPPSAHMGIPGPYQLDTKTAVAMRAFSLQIRPVTLEDDGQFQCQSSEQKSVAIRSCYVTLAAHIPPETPQVPEDQEVELECKSHARKPAAEIDDDGNLIPRSPSLLLEVKYAPKMTIIVELDRIAEFEAVKLSCYADVNSSNVVYKWYINDEIAYGDYSNQLTTDIISRKLNLAVVKCVVTNAIMISEDTQTLNVHYNLIIWKQPSNVGTDIDSFDTLRYDVDGNPELEMTRRYEGSRQVLSIGPWYTFWMIIAIAEKYTFTARVPGFSEVTTDGHVMLKGSLVVTSKRIQFSLEADTVRVECAALAIPRPYKVIWSQLELDVDSGDSCLPVLKDVLPDEMHSTFIMRLALDKYFGSYNCSVTINAYDIDAAEIQLKNQKSLPLLVILLSEVIGEMIVIIACALVVVLCNRREAIKEVDKGGCRTSKQLDQTSNNDSDLKVDIRTASSLGNPPESEQWDDSTNTMGDGK